MPGAFPWHVAEGSWQDGGSAVVVVVVVEVVNDVEGVGEMVTGGKVTVVEMVYVEGSHVSVNVRDTTVVLVRTVEL